MNDRASRLAGYIPEPKRELALLDLIEKADRPMILREIAEGLGRPRAERGRTLTTPLARLVDKGLLNRVKVAMTYPHGRYPGRTQTRQTWVYSAAPKSE